MTSKAKNKVAETEEAPAEEVPVETKAEKETSVRPAGDIGSAVEAHRAALKKMDEIRGF